MQKRCLLVKDLDLEVDWEPGRVSGLPPEKAKPRLHRYRQVLWG